MAHCGIDGQDQYPTLTVQLHGRGEDVLRMEKRLHCAGRALGVNVRVERETGDFGEARVTMANHLLAERLVSTETLEALLRQHLDSEGIHGFYPEITDGCERVENFRSC